MVLGFLASGCATGTKPQHGGVISDPAGADATGTDPTALPLGVRVFESDGTPSSWDALLEAGSRSRVILLGETHDDLLGHRTRHALVRALAELPKGDAPVGSARCVPHVISLEMLETDVQTVVDEYQSGLITRDQFRRAARPWENHDRDYEPYLEVARECGFPVVAANPPRRYVNIVARRGEGALDALSPEALTYLPPLPVARPSDRYRAEWDDLMGELLEHRASDVGGEDRMPDSHDPPYSRQDRLLKAQNLWDAGMAWAVARAAEAHPEARVIHVAGAFHVQRGTGIPEHLEQYLPRVEPLLVVATPVPVGAGFDPERHAGLGHFILLTAR